MKLKEIRTRRELLLGKQKGICPLCGTTILPSEATLDHCHTTGHTRRVLHRSCNSAEGRILSWAGKRSRGDDPAEFLRRLLRYWRTDYSGNPVHPRHNVKVKRRRRCRYKK
jgi:hypothetical protein